MVDQKQLENVEYFSCWGIVITNDARCTRDITFRIAMAKTSLDQKTLFTYRSYLRQELVDRSFVWCLNLDTTESRSGIPVKPWNVVLEKDGEDLLGRSREKWSITLGSKDEGSILHTIKRSMAFWVGHFLRTACFWRNVTGGTIEGMGILGRRCKQLLDDFKETRRYCKLKAEGQYRKLWRCCFGRGYGPAVRQTTWCWWSIFRYVVWE
jgi:hypothetical protein